MVESTLTGRRSPGDTASRLRYKDQGGRYDSTPYASPGGSGSQSYWGATGTGAEHKYHYQKGSHGAFDELGYTEKIPQGGIAPFAQFESERIVAQRNARLMGEAVTTIGDARSNALGRMESYRPGGAAALASGIDMQAGMGMANMLAASRTEAPDLLYQNRRDRSRRAAQKARQMQYIQLGVQAAVGIATAASGGGALAAGLTAAGNVGTALINKGESGQQQLQGTGGGASSFKQVPQTEQQKKQDALGGAQGFIEVPKDRQQQQQGRDQGSQLQSQGGEGLLGGGGVVAAGALPGMPGGAPGGPGSTSQLGGSPGEGPGGPTSPGAGPITATGGPISMPSTGGGDPGDVSGARFLRDAQAEGIDLGSLRAMSQTQDEDERDDYLGFLELWNADIDALLYAS